MKRGSGLKRSSGLSRSPAVRKEETPLIRADRKFSSDVRDYHTGEDGLIGCYTCGGRLPKNKMQLGHFIPRANLQTRFDWRNCKPQCKKCNILKAGNLEVFSERLRAEYGEDVVSLLRTHEEGFKLTRKKLEEICLTGSKIGL